MAAVAPVACKGKRKWHLSEDDVWLLLHRYHPGMILTALQEVAQHTDGRRIDWTAVVAKSTTGITSARKYQMLWRHFAYHHDIDESVDAYDQPLDDDNDLELELEPDPNLTKETLCEASALANVSLVWKAYGRMEREAPSCVAFALPFFNTLFYHDQYQEALALASLIADEKKLGDCQFDLWKQSYVAACTAVYDKLRCSHRLDAVLSGCTALSIVKQGDLMVVANVSDSHVVLSPASDDDAITSSSSSST
ncbi:putative protein phosphatase 2C 48 [Zea mays]|uniref:protein-serine/threonine phosphatase n=1 Tax=Zea mays TaxID=4577 RepID=A0A3L6FZS8_MAIZE|nr:putative protein phosphatase 2C 48 [Zea mays]